MRRTARLCRMAGAMELQGGALASPAAAKRAAIIERYGLSRIPPIPVPSLEQVKADAGAKVPASKLKQTCFLPTSPIMPVLHQDNRRPYPRHGLVPLASLIAALLCIKVLCCIMV